MFQINKITSNPVVDFAAEELKKYLRMMMPRCGEIQIRYNPSATDGFRLGLMEDFSLDTSEAQDTFLDDILHIDTDSKGGIISGSNPRSVLLSVYRFLTINGCRWLYPGIDGEYIPAKDIEPTFFHKMADCRYRGQCNEGAEYQQSMLDMIDFTPKIGMNIFMLEFDNPKVYYNAYYDHKSNETNREPEPVNALTVLQWKRQCEAEIARRGLQFHDMGHGWTAEALGIRSDDGWEEVDEKEVLPEESRQYLAMMDGKRALFRNTPIVTNICMSNPVARKMFVTRIADYAQLATNVDYLHVWLADSRNNHCECEECAKMIPSDWYIMMMNELDEELTRRNLDTRIVFICYVDTTWAPEVVKLRNPDRFSLLVAAISRNYTEPVDPNLDADSVKLAPYERNKLTLPTSVNEYLAHAKRWRDHCDVNTFVYEYHFWLIQYRDLGLLDSAKLIYNDIIGYKANGCNGIVEDGSQRCFFPNGFSLYVYASTLFDTSADFEAMKEDYFSHAYGEDWKEVVAFFEKLGKAVDYRYPNGKLSADKEKGNYYNPDIAAQIREGKKIAEDFEAFVTAHKKMPLRVQTLSMRLLKRYLEYTKGVCHIFTLKALGAGTEAQDALYSFLDDFGKYEVELEQYYDQYMCALAFRIIFGQRGTYIPF